METLDNLLLKVVDKTMKQVFTETGTKVIYDFLENNSRLKREEIAKKPKIFSTGMKKLLGSGAPVIEKMILKDLYSKLELKLEEKDGYEFSDHIKELRKRLMHAYTYDVTVGILENTVKQAKVGGKEKMTP